MHKLPKLRRARFTWGVVVGLLLTSSVAFSADLLNTPEGGYLLCIQKNSKVATYPATQKCPSGTTRLVLGARGPQGIPGTDGKDGAKGEQGAPGLKGEPGIPGKDGKNGEDGLPGSPGFPGSPGAQGSPGTPGFFKVYDRNNELVGTLLGSWNAGTSFDVMTPSGLVELYDKNGIISTPGYDVWFLDSNCSGTPYIETRSLYRYMGDGRVDYNQRIYSDQYPLVFLKGIPIYNQTNNFSTDKVFYPIPESRTATTIYTPTDYFNGSANTLGCFAYPVTDTTGPRGTISSFDVTELRPFTGTLRLRFVGPLSVR